MYCVGLYICDRCLGQGSSWFMKFVFLWQCSGQDHMFWGQFSLVFIMAMLLPGWVTLYKFLWFCALMSSSKNWEEITTTHKKWPWFQYVCHPRSMSLPYFLAGGVARTACPLPVSMEPGCCHCYRPGACKVATSGLIKDGIDFSETWCLVLFCVCAPWNLSWFPLSTQLVAKLWPNLYFSPLYMFSFFPAPLPSSHPPASLGSPT